MFVWSGGLLRLTFRLIKAAPKPSLLCTQHPASVKKGRERGTAVSVGQTKDWDVAQKVSTEGAEGSPAAPAGEWEPRTAPITNPSK